MKQYSIHFMEWKCKTDAFGQYLHEADLSDIYSIINNIKENIQQIEKNKAPVTWKSSYSRCGSEILL